MSIGPTFFPPLGPARQSGTISPTGWDRATLADKVLPGLSRITQASVRLKIDRKKKTGADGSNPTYHGIDPQPVELEIETYSDDDRELLASIVRPLIPQPGQIPKPVSFDHPSVRMLGISAVQVIGASALFPSGPQRTRMTLYLEHWLPTTKAVATTTPHTAPTRKPPNNRAPANPTPNKQPGIGNPPAGLKAS